MISFPSDKGIYAGFHFFEKVHDFPTRGASGVEHFTINGSLFLAFIEFNIPTSANNTSDATIYKMKESTGRFSLYQTLQSYGSSDIEYFTIGEKHFLALDSLSKGGDRLNSSIYQWNGKVFVVIQKIPRNAPCRFTSFAINNDKYLAVSNRVPRLFGAQPVVYKWTGSHFNKFKEVATYSAAGCVAFEISNNFFIAFADTNDSQGSTVFKWTEGHLAKVQSLQTYGAHDVKSFQINGHIFLAFANLAFGGKKNINSFIYKWNGNKFDLFQSIPTRGAFALHPFVISGQPFLGVVNYQGDIQKEDTKSVVYQASGSRFVNYQEIPTHAATDMTSFEYKGDTYLAVTNTRNSQESSINSALYKWV